MAEQLNISAEFLQNSVSKGSQLYLLKQEWYKLYV